MHRIKRAFVLVLALAPLTAYGQNLSTPKDVFRANIEATGGQAAWDAVSTMHTTGEMVVAFDMGTLVMTTESWLIRPGHMLTKMTVLEAPQGMPAGDNTMYISPEGGWIDGFQGRQNLNDLPPAQRASVRAGTYGKEELALLERPDEDFALLEARAVDGKMAYVVEVSGPVATRRLYDQESLLLVGTESPSPMGGMAMALAKDYEETSGLLISRTTETDIGTGTMTITIKEVDVNGDVTPEQLAEWAEQ